MEDPDHPIKVTEAGSIVAHAYANSKIVQAWAECKIGERQVVLCHLAFLDRMILGTKARAHGRPINPEDG